MKEIITTLFYLMTAILVASCALQTPQFWDADERSGLGAIDSRFEIVPVDIVPFDPKNKLIDIDKKEFSVIPRGKMIEKMISVPIDAAETSGLSIDLYYFIRMPNSGRAKKTVLFCPGGPGQFIPGPAVLVTIADFLVDHGYNVVFYHARGAGFSQIPPSNNYDKFLKTSYVLEDIEAVRRDLVRQGFLGKDGRWDAVIGYSFGSNVAQQYAGTYKNNLERLILIGVQSRHGFESLPTPLDQIMNETREINRYTLDKIYQRAEFNDPVANKESFLTPQQKSFIIDKAFGTSKQNGIFQIAEEKFGSLGYVISAYCELKDKNELGRYNLDYSLQFFRALGGLRDVGWLPTSDEPTPRMQLAYGMQIRDAILGGSTGASVCGPDMTGWSDRVRSVVSVYDGIKMTFL